MSDGDDDNSNVPRIVLINHEEQYSLWRVDVDIPEGWRQVFGPDSEAECMKYVDEVWTDMRPLSLRKLMERQAEEKRQQAGQKKLH